ncbi:double-headed protease inhibitor, submandibular gland-like [Crassostrea virginica]
MTYANPCKATQAKSRIISNGECPRRCACPRLYRPVCGEDGVTYPNRCVAGCMSGVYEYKYGECRQEDNKTEDKVGQGLLDRIRNSPPIEIRTN